MARERRDAALRDACFTEKIRIAYFRERFERREVIWHCYWGDNIFDFSSPCHVGIAESVEEGIYCVAGCKFRRFHVGIKFHKFFRIDADNGSESHGIATAAAMRLTRASRSSPVASGSLSIAGTMK